MKTVAHREAQQCAGSTARMQSGLQAKESIDN